MSETRSGFSQHLTKVTTLNTIISAGSVLGQEVYGFKLHLDRKIKMQPGRSQWCHSSNMTLGAESLNFKFLAGGKGKQTLVARASCIRGEKHKEQPGKVQLQNESAKKSSRVYEKKDSKQRQL